MSGFFQKTWHEIAKEASLFQKTWLELPRKPAYFKKVVGGGPEMCPEFCVNAGSDFSFLCRRQRVVCSSRACRNCEKAGAFCARLFQAACGNHQQEVAEGYLDRFPQLRQFRQAFFLFWSFFLSL